MHVHGGGNQVTLSKPVLAFYRAAWYFDKDVSKVAPCPPLSDDVVAAIENEANPTEEIVFRFYEVLQRVYE